MAKNLKSATIFFKPNTNRPRKYRNISNPIKFADFAAKAGAWYINWYDQGSGNFDRRTWLITDFRKK